MSEENIIETEIKEPKEKKSFLSKLIGWVIKIAIAGALAYYIIGLKSEKKDNFIKQTIQEAVQSCNKDTACIENLKKNGKSCFDINHTTQKSGKYNKDHNLDINGFNECLESHM